MKFQIRTARGCLVIDATCDEAAILQAQDDGHAVLGVEPIEVPRAP